MSSAASDAARQGYYSEAARLLGDVRKISDRVLRLEVDYYLGYTDRVRTDGRKLYSDTSSDPRLAFRVASIVASQFFDDGAIDDSIDYSQRSVSLAERSGDPVQLAAGTCTLLERTCIRTTFKASLPLALSARRASIRCGLAEVAARTHLTFGRLEARVGHFESAKRHFALCRSLLPIEPDLVLGASLDLDESSLRSLVGDVPGALEIAKRAMRTAQVSGWSKGVVAAAANCAYFSVVIGDFESARRFVANATHERFQSPSYRLALDDTNARLASADGDMAKAEALVGGGTSASTQPWYQLSAAETLVRLMSNQRRWREALDYSERALEFAKQTGTESFIPLMELARSNALLGLGADPQRIGLPLELTASASSPSTTGSLYHVLGKALELSGSNVKGRAYLERSARITREGVKTSTPMDTTDRNIDSSDVPGPPDLDSAVALIELGAHTHILAREALAVIDAARCARGAAIVATGAEGPRVIDRRGWDEAAAAAAARKPGACEVIPLGDHRDEPWQLVVDPQPDLDHRCSLIAIRKLIGMALTLERYRRDEQQRAALWPAESLDGDPESIWASEQMSEVLGVARRVAPTPLSLLLTGETGTGKEMLARAIHRASDRADRPMIPFNCTAVPRDMIESQLFGYRRGSFTGADASFAGVIRSAAGGTLFLDEIADVPVDVQPKLLRFLETHEIHPLGETQPVKVDVRVIAATNARLEELVAEGRFREDLFYRLNVVRLKLPPLRERREEIPPLVDHYLRKYGDEQKKGRLTLADETLEYLLLYSWPGNVRQLANEVRRMVAMAEADSALTPALLSPEIQASRRTIPAGQGVEAEVRVRIDQPLPVAVELLEQTMVKSALDKTHGRVEEAARILGISRKGLFLKRRRWGLSLQHH